MSRNPLACAGRWLALGLILVALSACSRSADATRPTSASIEQATHDAVALDRLVAPLHERRRLFADLGVDHWHLQGTRGQKIKVAILDSGFRDYRSFLGKGLPARVNVRSFRRDRDLEARDSQHGILCGEALHTLAPDAEMLLANWEPDSPRAFLDAVRWAKEAGAKIISCSLIMPSWSDGEGGGEVHRGLQELLGAGDDVLFFASAGNTAQRHWCGAFDPNEAGWHRWHDDAADNAVTPWGRERVAVELYGPVRSAYEVSVWRRSGSQPAAGAARLAEVVGKSVLEVDSTKQCGRAVVRFEPEPNVYYQIRVRRLDDLDETTTESFHLVILGGWLEHAVGRGSIPFPGDGPAVIAVGAVNSERARLAYSSCGPNSRQPKPDFVATVPFPSLCRAQPFAGTSAAAPQAAGLAALLWSRQPDWTASQVIRAMRAAAVDLGPAGHDPETGYGLIRLPQ